MTGNIPPMAYSVADYQKIQTELTQLRAENANLKASIVTLEDNLGRLQSHSHKQEAENAELRAKLATCEKLPQ